MDKNRELTKEEILKKADTAIGKNFEYYNYSGQHNKGGFGQIIEEELFEYKANSDSGPDFSNANIELKVTPYKENKNGTFSSKERLVLNIINYMKEHNKDFYTSSFWNKNQHLLILFYKYVSGLKKKDFVITHKLLYDYPEEDFEIIKQDWHIIINKIRAGLAHEISEADTLYLAACTKGVNSRSMRKQPFSSILAKQRAYSFKQSYMTQLVRQLLSSKQELEPILTSEELRTNTFEEAINSKLTPYFGKSEAELCSIFNLETKAKSKYALLISRMLKINNNLSHSKEFIMANITPKTIRVEENGKIKEHMSFPAFNYKKIVSTSWIKSNLRNLFETTKFMFIVFQKKDGEYYFEKIKFWNMPLSVLDNQVKETWLRTKEIISSGDIVKSVSAKGIRRTNFPGSRYNHVCHVRPHAINSSDTYKLPVADKKTNANEYTKHCFWLDKDYILEIIG